MCQLFFQLFESIERIFYFRDNYPAKLRGSQIDLPIVVKLQGGKRILGIVFKNALRDQYSETQRKQCGVEYKRCKCFFLGFWLVVYGEIVKSIQFLLIRVQLGPYFLDFFVIRDICPRLDRG